MKITQEEGARPIKAWTDDIEESAWKQAQEIARLPFIHKNGVALMPDVHAGIGSTVGTVIATERAIIPAAVGVDIGCGMNAVRTSLTASDLPDTLRDLRHQIERDIPLGPGGKYSRDSDVQENWTNFKHLGQEFETLSSGTDAPKIRNATVVDQLGSLGSGNHFIELCLDESQDVWVMLHSGSRGTGNQIGRHFIEKAKREAERWMITLPNNDLAYLPEGSEHFDRYVAAVDWAQNYALANRAVMMDRTLAALKRHVPKPFELTSEAVNCFPGDAEVSAVGVTEGFKRWYEGMMVDLVLESGKKISVTPNHPFLCGRGWVAANLLQEGDQLVSTCGGDAGIRWIEPDVDNLPTQISEAVSAVGAMRHPRRIAGDVVNFHGDFGTGQREVDVVLAERELRFGVDAPILQQFAEAGFADTDLVESDGVSDRFISEFFGRRLLTSASAVGLLGERAALRIGELAHPQRVGFAPGTEFDASAAQDIGQAGLRASDALSKTEDAFTSTVAFDRIVKVERREWAGHVYNLSTESGYYVINSVIVHNCHHNYVERENHFGSNLWVTRKGAIRAREGDLGIIPGSMGQRSYIVCGKGNAESYCSCSHGAGRRMSRTAARKYFTVEDLKNQTEGVECLKTDSVLDEIPGAYKDIDEVMANQTDLVEVVHTLKAVLCVKGS